MNRLFKTISYLAPLVWGVITLFILVGVYYDHSVLFINLIMAIIFMLITYYLYLKANNSLSLLSLRSKKEKNWRIFYSLEIIFFICSNLVGLLLLSGTISRVFYEKMAVFG